MINRQNLIRYLKEKLEPLEFVNALWLEGADALNRVDDYSDIDLWLDIEPEYFPRATALIRELLKDFLEFECELRAELELDLEVSHPDEFIEQAFFHLAGSSKFLIIDLCMQSGDRMILLDPKLDKVQVLFDKTNVIKYQSFPEKIEALTLYSEDELKLYSIWIEKHLARQEYLTAFKHYQERIIEPIVVLLRHKYSRSKLEFGMKHIYADLPAESSARLERLSFMPMSELPQAFYKARAWLESLIQEVKAG